MRSGRLKSLIAAALVCTMALPSGIFAGAPAKAAKTSDKDQVKVPVKIPIEKRYSEDQVIVTFDSDLTNKKIDKVLGENDGAKEDMTKVDDRKIVLAKIGEDSSVGEMIENLEGEKNVINAQPNYVYKLSAQDPFLQSGNRKYQYHVGMVKAMDAWKKVEAAKKQTTKVAVIDTGVDKNHEDLKNVVKSYKMLEAGELKEGTEDTSSHGTHVTGIIGAEYGNGKGGAGVASGTKNDLSDISVYAASEDGENLFSYDVVAGIKDAVKNGAKVINMSFGSDYRDRLLESVIKEAYYDKGVVFVAAAGNEMSDNYSHPSDMNEVISVCSCDESGYKAASTSFGLEKDVTAPGTSITSTVPFDMYYKSSGTSMAAPIVSGICALMLDADPKLTPAQVRNIISGTAVKEPKGAKENYYLNNEMGYGLVDASAAVDGALLDGTDEVDSINIKGGEKGDAIKIYTEDFDNSLYGGKDNKYIAQGRGLETLITPVNSSAKIQWSSDDESIAKVDSDGYVKGIKAGESTTIRAKAGGKTASVRVQVLGSTDPTGVKLNVKNSEKEIFVGEFSFRLFESLEIEPSNATNLEMYWFSSDKKVLSVDDHGIITARKPGKAVITVKTYNGKTASCEMTVKEPPASIEITDKTDWLTVGQKHKYSGVVKNSKGSSMSEMKLGWDSGNKTLADVSNDGTVKAKNEGIFYLYANTKWNAEEGGELFEYKKITITKKNYKGKDYALKVKKKGKKSVKLKWKNILKNNGYELFRANGKKGKFKKVKSIKKDKTVFTDKKLKKGKTYYYKVRAKYNKNGKRGKYSFSNKVKAKIKKAKSKKAKSKKSSKKNKKK